MAPNTSAARLGWAERQGIRIEHIPPSKLQQNNYVERYNRTVRYAWLAQALSDSIGQVQQKATRWLGTYDHERPNMALGGISRCRNRHSPLSSTSAR